MRYLVRTPEGELHVEVVEGEVRVDGVDLEAEWAPVEGTPVSSLLVGNRSYRVSVVRGQGGRWTLEVAGWRLDAVVEDERKRALSRWVGAREVRGGTQAIRAPMPGLVVKVEVNEGEEVAAGQAVLVVEAMKMENELRAEAAGRVSRVWVQAGEAVEKDQMLLEIAVSSSAVEGAGPGEKEGEKRR